MWFYFHCSSSELFIDEGERGGEGERLYRVGMRRGGLYDTGCNCILKSIIVVGFNLFHNRNHLIVTIHSGFKSLSH